MAKGEVEIFLDSGAFGAHTRGIPVDIEQYMGFIRESGDEIDVYANLDVIGDPEGTLANQKKMEDAGLHPLPCFHFDKDWWYLEHYWSYLERYVAGYKYIALGGVAWKKGPPLSDWLDQCFKIICDENGYPRVKVHGFAITDPELLYRYPFESVDSTSWINTGRRLSSVYVPQAGESGYDYGVKPWSIVMSSTERTKGSKLVWGHLDENLTKHCEKYFSEKGHAIGRSDFKLVDDPHYHCEKDERLNPHVDKGGKIGVEIIIEKGLCNNIWLLDELNAIYYKDLESSIPEWDPTSPLSFLAG